MSTQDVQRAAVRLFANKGFAATGIRELGAAAGINSATIYHYAQGGKGALLTAIMHTCLEELLRRGREAVDASADPQDQLVGLVRGHIGTTALNPLTALVTDQEVRSLKEPQRSQLVEMRDAYESLFTVTLKRGSLTGAFAVEDVSLTRLALLEMCNGVAHWFNPDGPRSIEQVEAYFVDLTLRMVNGDADRQQPPRHEPVRLATEPGGSRSASG